MDSVFEPSFLATVAKAVAKATLGGCLLAAVVWLLCRVFPRITAPARFWLWWLVCAKFVAGFVFALWVGAITIRAPRHVLPPTPQAAVLLRRWASPPKRAKATVPSVPVRATPVLTDSESGSQSTAPSPVPFTKSSPAFYFAPIHVAGLLWLCGVCGALLLQIRATAPLRRMAQYAEPLDLTEITYELCTRLGLRRAPLVAASPNIAGPLVLGLFHPTILLPAALLGVLSPTELRLALAHELAHLQRGDLWLGLVPYLARTLFFFAPPVHFACRECILRREEACDALAISATNVPPALYGALLLKTVSHQRTPPTLLAAPMAAAHFGQVRQRLLALSHPASAQERRIGTGLALVCILGLVPWRVAAIPNGRIAKLAEAVTSTPQTRYHITDLGTLGGRHSDAFALSETGNVAGAANVYMDGSRGHAFLWNSGEMHDLATGSIYRRSAAQAVNMRGQVAAWAYNRRSRPSAFLWDGKTRRYLGALAPFRYGRALGLNDRGQVVGVSQSPWTVDGALPTRPFLWENGRMRDLGTLGGPYATAYAINETGVVVGKADMPRNGSRGDTHATRWLRGTAEDLGTLDGGSNSAAYAVNAKGDAVGFSESASGTRAFWHDRTTMHDLGLPDGVESAVAYDINDTGRIVGAATLRAENGKEARRAILWTVGTNGAVRTTDLNELLTNQSGWTLEAARSINNRGQIAGVGWQDGKRRAFLLTPEL